MRATAESSARRVRKAAIGRKTTPLVKPAQITASRPRVPSRPQHACARRAITSTKATRSSARRVESAFSSLVLATAIAQGVETRPRQPWQPHRSVLASVKVDTTQTPRTPLARGVRAVPAASSKHRGLLLPAHCAPNTRTRQRKQVYCGKNVCATKAFWVHQEKFVWTRTLHPARVRCLISPTRESQGWVHQG